MDSLTHIALGACIGEAFAGKKLGKKAMLWGALLQSIPDIDFIAGTWLSPSENLLAHRGFTHSILFAIIVVPLLALLAEKLHRPHNIQLKKYLLFFSVEILIHLFIDGFNAYGIGWLEPFSHHRFSFNIIFVADPFFSIWAGIAFLMLLVLKRHSVKRKFWWKFGVIVPAIYLSICCINKIKINADAKKAFVAANISSQKYFTTPTPFNNLLWYVVAETDSGFYAGYRSVFDKQTKMQLSFFPRNEYLLKNVLDQTTLQNLKRFSKGFYTASLQNDTLVFNDLRFEQIAGWQNADAPFVFHYFLQQGGNAACSATRSFCRLEQRKFCSINTKNKRRLTVPLLIKNMLLKFYTINSKNHLRLFIIIIIINFSLNSTAQNFGNTSQLRDTTYNRLLITNFFKTQASVKYIYQCILNKNATAIAWCADGDNGQTIYTKSLLHLNDSAIKITAADSLNQSCNETEPQFSPDGK